MARRCHTPQIRTGGWLTSSTRAELATVVMALQGTPQADDLAILIDSTASRCFRGHDFRPAEHNVKDYDIIHDILCELKLRSESSSRTLFVKVLRHSGTHSVEKRTDWQQKEATKKVTTKTLCVREAEAKR